MVRQFEMNSSVVMTENTTDPRSTVLYSSDVAEYDNGQILSMGIRELCELVISCVTLLISLMGVATNSINIRVFLKQGLMTDSTTIGFFALAIADFLACIVSLPQAVCFVFKMVDEPAKFLNCHAATLMSSQYPRIVFSRISCWISVYIAVERCLCVLMPLKVKLLIRPKLSATVMISIYIFFGLFHLPLGTNTRLAWVFNTKLNQSVIVVTETAIGKKALYYQSLIGTTIMSSTAVVIVAFSTALLIYKLNVSRKWSKTVSTKGMQGANASLSNVDNTKKQHRKRDLEVMKTVSAVTGLFLVCLTMSHIPALASLAIPGFSITGNNSNLLFLLYNFKFLFDTINSASNFFFYINISSRYKAAFDAVFKGKSRKK